MDRASNFDHLEALDAGLAAFGRFAEGFFVDDPNTALIKARQFGERLATLIADHAGLPIAPKTAFVDVLRALQVHGAAPCEVLDVLHKLRRTGNEAAHDAQGERRDPKIATDPTVQAIFTDAHTRLRKPAKAKRFGHFIGSSRWTARAGG